MYSSKHPPIALYAISVEALMVVLSKMAPKWEKVSEILVTTVVSWMEVVVEEMMMARAKERVGIST